MDRFDDFYNSFMCCPEAEVTECAVCGCDIQEGEDVYSNPFTEEYFCCQECAVKSVAIVQSIAVDGVCEQCGAILSSEFESLESCGDVFCDEECFLNYNEISEVEA